MTANKLRAVATAFLLGTAALGGAMVLSAAPAYAAGVRPEIGAPLQAAQSLAAAGNYKAAMAKVEQAEAVSNKTADETAIISQMKQYIGAKSGDVSIGGAAAAKTKLANDYNARNYAGVIADADALRKGGGLDGATMQVVAQSYYLSGNKAGCIKYIKNNFGSGADETTLQLEMKCAYDISDDDTQREVVEMLVSRTGDPKYWNQLLKLSENAKNLNDHETLDINRIKLLTGSMNGKDDYTLLAQLAMQLGFPGEGLSVVNKGMAANLLNDDRSKRLQALAQQQAAKTAAGMPAALAAANKDPNGDALIKIAEQQWGNGDAKSAVDTAKAGMAKPLKDKENATIVLGLAQISSGQSPAAIKTLNSLKDGNGALIAHLLVLYADHPSSGKK